MYFSSNKALIAGSKSIMEKVLLLILVIISAFSCSKEKSGSRIVYFQNIDEILIENLSTQNITSETINNDSISAIMVNDGDFLEFNLMGYYLQVTPDIKDTVRLELDSTEYALMLDGKIFSMIIGSDSSKSFPIPLIPEENFHELKCITFSGLIEDHHTAFLKRLQKINSDPIFAVDASNISTINTLGFTPKTIVYNTDHNADLEVLSEFSQLDNLIITAFNDYPEIQVPVFTGLKKLLINLEDASISGSISNMDQLEELKINTYDPSMMSDFAKLPHLRSLWIGGSDSVINLQKIDTLIKLERLIIKSESDVQFENFQNISKLESLKWLGIPINTDQVVFDKIISSLKKIECLELYNTGDSLSLAVLTELPNLRYLKLADTISDRQTIPLLTNLELLSIPEKIYNDSLYLDELNQALPNTAIVPNAGLCMGSGWILLSIPVFFLLLLIKLEWNGIKIKRKKNA